MTSVTELYSSRLLLNTLCIYIYILYIHYMDLNVKKLKRTKILIEALIISNWRKYTTKLKLLILSTHTSQPYIILHYLIACIKNNFSLKISTSSSVYWEHAAFTSSVFICLLCFVFFTSHC